MTNPDTTIAAQVAPCATCRYWHRDDATYTFGMCHRWPPRAGLWVTARRAGGRDSVEINMQTNSAPEWPNTAHDDGCGEHQGRGNQQ